MRANGGAQVVSRAGGVDGALADAASSDAAISSDGRRVAFTSAATNVAAGKADNRRGVFVRDLRRPSQQSHQVSVRSGPASVSSPPQAAGAWSARLKKPGTYEFVCAIHAPGMRMTAVVSE